MIGNGHAVRVAPQIAQGMLGAAEGTLGVNDPIGTEQTAQQRGESTGLMQMRKLTVKAEFTGGVQYAKASNELAAEYAAKNLDWQEEVIRCRNPAGVVWGEAAGWDYAVDMRMMQQLLIPGMEHAEESNLGAEMARVAGDLQQGVGSSTK